MLLLELSSRGWSLAVGFLLLLTNVAHAQLCNPQSGQPPPANGLPSCSLPVDSFASGRPVPGSRALNTSFPPWMNLTLARQGQAFAHQNIFFMGLGAFGGLISGLPIPDEASVLAFTGHTADPSSAVQRYGATATQLQVWMEDLFCSDPIDNAVLTSIGHVRDHHIKAAQRANAVGLPYVPPTHYDGVATDDVMWAAVAADLNASSLPFRTWGSGYSQYNGNTTAINQFSQGLTLMQFMGFQVIDPTSLYIWNATDDDLKAYMHMWAVLGWLLGIEDDYNVCLQPDPATAAAYLKALNEKYVYPAWFQIDKIGKVLVEAVLNNYNRYFPAFGPRPLMVRILRDYFGIGVQNIMATLSLADRLTLQTFDVMFVPSTHNDANRLLLNTGFDEGINSGVLAFFGPYVTYMQKAENVFYPNATG